MSDDVPPSIQSRIDTSTKSLSQIVMVRSNYVSNMEPILGSIVNTIARVYVIT